MQGCETLPRRRGAVRRIVKNTDLAAGQDIQRIGGLALTGCDIADDEWRWLELRREREPLLVCQRREQLQGFQEQHPRLALARFRCPAHFAGRIHEHFVTWNRDFHALARQRREGVHANLRIRPFLLDEIGQPVTDDVADHAWIEAPADA